MSAFLPLKTSDKQGTTCNLPYVRHVAYGQAGGMNTTTYGQQKGRIIESVFGHETVILVVQTRLEHAWVLAANINLHSKIERAGEHKEICCVDPSVSRTSGVYEVIPHSLERKLGDLDQVQNARQDVDCRATQHPIVYSGVTRPARPCMDTSDADLFCLFRRSPLRQLPST